MLITLNASLLAFVCAMASDGAQRKLLTHELGMTLLRSDANAGSETSTRLIIHSCSKGP